MYPVSYDYEEAINSRVVQSDWYGEIYANTTINFNRTNLDQNQSKLTRQIVSGDTLEIGNAFSDQLTLRLRGEYTKYIFFGAEIRLWFSLCTDIENDYYEDVFMGTFKVTDAEFQYNSVKLTAYDKMQDFSEKIGDMFKQEGMETITPDYALETLCNQAGISFDSTDMYDMPNHDVELPMSTLEESLTLRDVVGYIAAILGANAIIERDEYNNYLKLKAYSNDYVREIDVSARYSSTYIDYIGRYTKLALTNEDGDEEVYTASGSYPDSQTQLTLSIGTNPLLNAMGDDRETIAQNIIDAVATIVYAPCTIQMTQDGALDVGDTLRVSGGNITNPVNIIITKMDAKLYGQMQIVSAGGDYKLAETKTKADKIETSIPQAVKKMDVKLDEVQQEIKQITYEYVDPQVENTDPIGDGKDAIVLAFYFNLEEPARVRFGSTINFETARDGQDLVHLHVIYNVDNTELNPNDPLIEYYDDGHHILTLDFLTDTLAAGSHSFGVAFGVTGGTLS